MEFNKCFLVRALQPVATYICVKNFDVRLNTYLILSMLYIAWKP
jgi:hypothetical protein